MITFGEFAGTLITDFLQARKIADAYSAALSEEYYVNPVLRGMPVPHYTVDEAEIDVPMKIMGVRRAEITKEDLRNILVKIEQKLPVLLYRNIKNSYYEKQENIVFKKMAQSKQSRWAWRLILALTKRKRPELSV